MIDLPFQRQALADFLRTRRARLSPAAVGLPTGGRRRTSGLRREEVSSLANVGISWYTALEQGRDVHPSEGILNSLAEVLQLTLDEREHLFALAGYSVTKIEPAASLWALARVDRRVSRADRRPGRRFLASGGFFDKMWPVHTAQTKGIFDAD